MDTSGRDKRARIDPQPPDNPAPHLVRATTKNQIRRGRSREPSALGNFTFELARTPPRVTEKEANILGWVFGDIPKHLHGGRKIDAGQDGGQMFSVRDQRKGIAQQEPTRVELDGATPVHCRGRLSRPSIFETLEEVTDQHVGIPIQNQPETGALIVLDHQQDRPSKIRILHLRHRDQ